jgi:hypothetical protein
MHLFTPHHVALLEACYPNTSISRTDVSPKPQETSRLVYYASNRPEKLQKISKELEGKALREIGKIQSGSTRYRNFLLVTLALFRILATECREEISVLTPHLLKVVAIIFETFPTDLELLAKAAGVVRQQVSCGIRPRSHQIFNYIAHNLVRANRRYSSQHR